MANQSNGSWKDSQLQVDKDLCVDVVSTELSPDDLDVCCLVVTVLSDDFQQECEISKYFSGEFSTVESHECVVGIVGIHDAGVLHKM